MQIEVDAAAKNDLLEIIAWYDLRSSTAAEMFLQEFSLAVQRIAKFPKACPKVSRRARRCRLSRFPYGLIYQIRKNEIVIFAVMHLHRKPGYWKGRLK
jgi:plasmid stabilization system protein ParE